MASGSGCRADNPFHEVGHAFEIDRILAIGLARRNDGIALVVLQRSLEDGELAAHGFGQRRVECLAGLCRNAGAERAHLDEAVLQAAADEIAEFLAGLRLLDEVGIDIAPGPFGARQVFRRGERALVGMVAADEGAASGGRLDDDLRAVHMAGNDIGA